MAVVGLRISGHKEFQASFALFLPCNSLFAWVSPSSRACQVGAVRNLPCFPTAFVSPPPLVALPHPPLFHASRSRDCVKAHQSAIEVTKAIAAALRKADEAKAEESLQNSAHASSPPTTPGQRPDAPSEDQENELPSESTPSATTTAGKGEDDDAAAAAAAPPANGNTPAANSDGSAPIVVVGHKKCREEDESGGKGARPVLTLMQHLCASAPERAEGRARVAEGLAALLPELEESDRGRFVSFLAKVRFLLSLVMVVVCVCRPLCAWHVGLICCRALARKAGVCFLHSENA